MAQMVAVTIHYQETARKLTQLIKKWLHVVNFVHIKRYNQY